MNIRTAISRNPKRAAAAKRKIRRKLFDADPHCHWCGCEVRYARGGHLSDDAATLDHVVSKYERPIDAETTAVVLACHACNQRRAKEETMLLPEYQRRAILKRLARKLSASELGRAARALGIIEA